MQLKTASASLLRWLERDFAFHAGADYLFQHGYAQDLHDWVLAHGWPQSLAEAEYEHCVRYYYLR